MADRKISELTNITGASVDDANDEIAIVDTSASETKAITRAELMSSVSSMSITGDLTVDTNTLYVDSTNNRVGIGTSSPDESLHVVGRAAIKSGAALTAPNNANTNLRVEDGSGSCYVSVRSTDVDSAGLLFGDSTDDFAGGFLYDNANDSLSMHSGNSEAMRIDSSGNVGIGTSSPSTIIHLSDNDPEIRIEDSNNGIAGTSYRPNISFYAVGTEVGSVGMRTNRHMDIVAENFNSAQIRMFTGGSQRAAIDSSGNLLVGCTSSPSASVAGSAFIQTSNDNELRMSSSLTAGNDLVQFFNPNGKVGNISTNGSATTYSTSSDERLKENIADAQPASDLIDGIQVREFDWKADGEHQRYGMVAQELETVAPEAVTKGETEDDMWSVDYSKLVPMLVKEIQDLRKRVNELENTQ